MLWPLRRLMKPRCVYSVHGRVRFGRTVTVVSLGPPLLVPWSRKRGDGPRLTFISLDCGKTSVFCRNRCSSDWLVTTISPAWRLIDGSVHNPLVCDFILIWRKNTPYGADITGIIFTCSFHRSDNLLSCRFASCEPFCQSRVSLCLCSPQRLHGEGGGGVGQQPTEDAPRPRSARPQRRL